MKPAPFRYHRATSIDEAVTLLARYGDDAKILAGGQSLIPMMKLRLARPAVLVDINRIPRLAYRHAGDDVLRIGATARVADAATMDIAEFAMVSAAARHVGHPAIRHRATVCGSLAHADPAAELPLAAVCLDAEMVVVGPRETRRLTADRFFESALTTTLSPDELVTEVRFPALPTGAGWAFIEFTKRAGDFAIAAAAVTLTIGRDGVSSARIALGGVAERPVRTGKAERALLGTTADHNAARAAAAMAVEDLAPPSDVHGSGPFRRRIAAVLVERAVLEARERARPFA